MTKTQKFERLPLANLVLPAFSPRQHEDPHLLEELATSIAQKGVLEPIIVRPKGEKYQIVAGARRSKASRIAKQKDIPAIVRELTDPEAAEFAVIEQHAYLGLSQAPLDTSDASSLPEAGAPQAHRREPAALRRHQG